jgi:hypothetical protein
VFATDTLTVFKEYQIVAMITMEDLHQRISGERFGAHSSVCLMQGKCHTIV